MSAFFKWLAENPSAGYAFTALIIAVTIVLVVSFTTALIQGRTISYWPPQIGPKPDKAVGVGWGQRRAGAFPSPLTGPKRSATITAVWTSPAPDPEILLRNAKFSALVLGTSLVRIVNSDMFMYRDWLLRDKDRRLGMLFLNPFSPHAVARERRDVRRSSQQSILESMRVAYEEAAKNPQIVPAVYDGPFRYTARAIDIGPNFESHYSAISLVTSSHAQGISKGFQIDLNAAVSGEPYSFYRDELINQWKHALSNPPGHGVSIIARSVGHPMAGEFEEAIKRVEEAVSSHDVSVHAFDERQFHVTISALCRTQSVPYLGPLVIGQVKSPQYLPEHFGSFVSELAGKTGSMLDKDIEFKFARVRVDDRGYLNLEPGREHDQVLAEMIRAYRMRVAEQVAEYSARYPAEDWSALLSDEKQQRFGPKSRDFSVHITLGRAFSHGQSLPMPLQNGCMSVDLDRPISVPVTAVSIVHYAYRSLLRIVGNLDINLGQDVMLDEHRVLHRLGISY
jgi:hypothetical protein